MDLEDVPLSPEGDALTNDQHPKYQRSLRSLNLMAIRFVKLLQEAEGGMLDLKEAVKVLAVGQKRRIYDITNVLEGVGLITKLSNRMVKWVGALPGGGTLESTNRVTQLKLELADLEQQEYMLDQQKLWVEQSIRNTREDCSNLTYVNHEDLCNCFTGHTLLAVRAPSGTQLDVPIPKAVRNDPAKYQIHLKSFWGPVDVVLLNKSSPSSIPVVLPVPPPEEILRKAKLAVCTSDVTENFTAPYLASAHTGHCTKSRQTLMEDMWAPHSSSLINAESKRARLRQYLSKELKELLDPSKEITKADLFTKLMTAEVLSPLFRLSSQPPGQEFAYSREEGEGVSDHFDIPMLNV